MKNKLKFEVFVDGNESGRFLVNPFWLEHLLNLFFQGFVGEYSDEVQDTIINNIRTIENTGYGIIGQEIDKKHLPSNVRNSSVRSSDK